jgi:hypothetical protein
LSLGLNANSASSVIEVVADAPAFAAAVIFSHFSYLRSKFCSAVNATTSALEAGRIQRYRVFEVGAIAFKTYLE